MRVGGRRHRSARPATGTRESETEPSTMDHLAEDIPQRLLEAGLINDAARAKALQQQKNLGGSIMACLVKIGAISEEALLEFLSRIYSTPGVDLKN